jgi:hypothetical protein
MDKKSLAALLRILGARDADLFTSYGSDRSALSRFLFLRQAWRSVVSESDTEWIDQNIAEASCNPNEPYSGVGLAIASLRNRGATDSEITDLVRGMQARLLFALCYLLEDCGELEEEVPSGGWGWKLFETDDDGNALEEMYGLYELVLHTDPTGREMRPRGAG